jgi:ATP-dependent DNA ligase
VAVYHEQLRPRFDIFYREGRDLTARPLRGRRARLEDVVAGAARLPGTPVGADGFDAWQQPFERGYEGTRRRTRAARRGGG